MYNKTDRIGRKIVFMGYQTDHNRKVVIVKRSNDYAIGLRYDTKYGRWEQGIYDFNRFENALEYLIRYEGGISVIDYIELN